MKIDYTNFLRDKSLEMDQKKIAAMERAAADELAFRHIFYGIDFVCYADGCVKITVSGKYYNMFDTKTGKFFSGCVGDYPAEGTRHPD